MNTFNHQLTSSIIAQLIHTYTMAELFPALLSLMTIPLPSGKIDLKEPSNILFKSPNSSLLYICAQSIAQATLIIPSEDTPILYNPHSCCCFHAAPFNHVLSIMHSTFFNR